MEDRAVAAPPRLTTAEDANPFKGQPSRLTNLASWEPKSPETLVEGLFHRRGLGQIAALPGVGKSPIAADLTVAVANADLNGGTHWAGQAVRRRGPVVYVALESASTVQGYLAEACAARGLAPAIGGADVWVLEEPELSLVAPSTSEASLARVAHDVDEAGIRPVLFVFDTQVDMLGGVDDYRGTEVAPLIASLQRWCSERDAFGLVLHHTPHGASRGMGSVNIMGKVDTAAVLERQGDLVRMSVQKRKGLGSPFSPACCRFVTGPVVGTAQVEWVDTVDRAAATSAAEAAFGDFGRETRTKTAILGILKSPSAGMLRPTKPRSGWSDAEVCKALNDLVAKGQDVHSTPRYVKGSFKTPGPMLQLVAEELIENLAGTHKSGKSSEWALTPKGHEALTQGGSRGAGPGRILAGGEGPTADQGQAGGEGQDAPQSQVTDAGVV